MMHQNEDLNVVRMTKPAGLSIACAEWVSPKYLSPWFSFHACLGQLGKLQNLIFSNAQ